LWSRNCYVIRTPRLNRAAVHYGCRRQSPSLGSQFPLQNLAPVDLETPGRIDADADSGALFLLTQDAITIAARWFRLAAEQGHAEAQFHLGILYAPMALNNLVLAHKWLNLAAARGHVNAVEVLEIVESRMTPEQITEAQELAREWLAARE
jgi:TPR repeat protein